MADRGGSTSNSRKLGSSTVKTSDASDCTQETISVKNLSRLYQVGFKYSYLLADDIDDAVLSIDLFDYASLFSFGRIALVYLV